MRRYLGYWNSGYQGGEQTATITEKEINDHPERFAPEYLTKLYDLAIGEIINDWGGVLDFMFIVRIEDGEDNKIKTNDWKTNTLKRVKRIEIISKDWVDQNEEEYVDTGEMLDSFNEIYTMCRNIHLEEKSS